MFKCENNNQKIGLYLKKLIDAKYPSRRQFCKAYLLEAGIEVDDVELRKMSNRLSQMIKGKKAIQIYDLPFFTSLLEVSCEEILSCGKTFVPISGHITNYEVAFSKDRQVWQKYLDRPDKLILNYDEYNKTVIDYAIEFKNYDFIKFLIDEKYIWFVDDSKYDTSDRIFGYGAGTSIKRRPIGERDIALEVELGYRTEKLGLRQKVIALAMENKDFKCLDTFKAREIPALNVLCIYGYNARIRCCDYYNDDVIEAIVQSNDKVFTYFSEEFHIADLKAKEHFFIYPFLNKVIERLVKYDNKKYAEVIIRKAIGHNKKVFNCLSAIIDDAISYVQNKCPEWMDQNVMSSIMSYFKFFEEDGFVSYWYTKKGEDCVKFYSNVVYCDIVSGDLLLDSLIEEMNEIFNSVKNIEKNKNIERIIRI